MGDENENEAEIIFDEIITPNISNVTLQINRKNFGEPQNKINKQIKEKSNLRNIMDKPLKTKDREKILISTGWWWWGGIVCRGENHMNKGPFYFRTEETRI